MTTVVSQAVARAWIERWDAQQELYMSDREARFTVLIDTVAEAAGRHDPLVVDLGCGPGSLSARLLDRIPEAIVVAVDADPLLLGLGRAGYASTPIRFAELDLAQPGWSSALALDRQADAAVSTTALHWLSGESLTTMYAEVAKFLRPGGVLLDGDHLREDKQAAPTLHRLGRALIDRQEQRVARDHTAETWEDWWDAVKRDPDLAGLVAERESALQQSDHHGSAAGRLDVHVAALRAAGFDEIGTLWQYGDNRLLCAIRS